jgi:hypothetical protein
VFTRSLSISSKYSVMSTVQCKTSVVHLIKLIAWRSPRKHVTARYKNTKTLNTGMRELWFCNITDYGCSFSICLMLVCYVQGIAAPQLRRYHWLLTAESRVCSQGDLRCTKWHWGRLLSESFGFPCQYHSTAAPYSLMNYLGGWEMGLIAATVPQRHRPTSW